MGGNRKKRKMDVIKAESFLAKMLSDGFTIEREGGSISLTSGESANAIKVLLFAMALEKAKVLPEHISNSPFEVRFTGERLLYLRRKDNKEGGVAFKFDEGDCLIKLIKDSSEKIKDINTVAAGTKGGFSPLRQPDTIIEGR